MILVKTPAGQLAFKERSAALSPRQRSAFILFDGKRSVEEVLAGGMGIVRDDVDQMVALGLLEAPGGGAHGSASSAPAAEAAAPASPVAAAATGAPAPGRSRQQRYKDAYPIATQLTGSLGLRGFRLNLQVEGSTGYEDLLALAPKIRAAVGPEKAAALDQALND